MRCKTWPDVCNKLPSKIKNNPGNLPVAYRPLRPPSRGLAASFAYLQRLRPLDAARFYFAIFYQIIFLLLALSRRYFGASAYRVFFGVKIVRKKGAGL
jgi:hypothetical protein